MSQPEKKMIKLTSIKHTCSFDVANWESERPIRSSAFGRQNKVFRLLAYKRSDGISFHLLKLHPISVYIKGVLHIQEKASQGGKVSLYFAVDFSDKYARRCVSIGKVVSASTAFKTICEITFERPRKAFDHTGNLCANLCTYLSTLQFDATSADITLLTTSDRRSFPAHQWILSARSPVFAAMFRNGEFTENQKKLVEIDDISGPVMEALLKYIYSGDVGGIEEIADELLVAADKYDISLLVKECTQVMACNLEVANVGRFYYLANLYSFKKFKKDIEGFIASSDRLAIQESEAFKEFVQPDSRLLGQFMALFTKNV